MNLSAGAVVAGRYRLLHELGRGGMGAVWRAHHVALNIPCAVKFVLGEAAETPEIRARFEQEAQAAAQLKSPNVVQILDHGLWEGSPYIAMELLEGEDLDHRLRRVGRLPLPIIAPIVTQVARALHKAHAAGLVHRDLKPANLFLSPDDDGEVVKILDFGIAKQTHVKAGSTRTGALLGTPSYMSPEQARGTKALDWRSDLWSLAVIVYECATGRLPFESDAFGDLLVQIMFNPLPVPSHVAEVPPGFDAWWAHAAAREPEARFQSAREMAEALAQVAASAGSTGVRGATVPIDPGTSGVVAPRVPVLGAAPPTGAALSLSASGIVAPLRRPSRSWIPLVGLGALVLAGGGVFLALRGSHASTPAVGATPDVTASASPPATAPLPAPPSTGDTTAQPPSTATSAAAPAESNVAPAPSGPRVPLPRGRQPVTRPVDAPPAARRSRVMTTVCEP